MNVTHFQRRRPPDKFSIEGYFQRVRRELVGHYEMRVYELPFLSKGFFRRVSNMAAAMLNQADINHITGDIHYVAMTMRPSRTILTIHDCQILDRLAGWKHSLVKMFWYTLPAKRVSIITVNSYETKRRLLDVINFPADRIVVIPVSISDHFAPQPKQFNDQCPKLLQVGTKPNKNLHRLAAAIEGMNCQLDILGTLSASDKEVLSRHAIRYENYTELSEPEVVEKYAKADIVCFASTQEGFGMPIVEAQAVERVCLTSNCSSMPEVAGDGAIFVDPFDVESIRDGIFRIINSDTLRTETIEAGRRNRERFQSPQIAAAYAEVYSQVRSGDL